MTDLWTLLDTDMPHLSMILYVLRKEMSRRSTSRLAKLIDAERDET